LPNEKAFVVRYLMEDFTGWQAWYQNPIGPVPTKKKWSSRKLDSEQAKAMSK